MTATVRYPRNDMENEHYRAATAMEAEEAARAGSAVNCYRTIEIADAEDRTVKGPYGLRRAELGANLEPVDVGGNQ